MLPPSLRYFIKHEIEDIFDLVPVLILGVGLAFAILILLLFVNTERDPAATPGPAGVSAPVAEDAAAAGPGAASTAADAGDAGIPREPGAAPEEEPRSSDAAQRFRLLERPSDFPP
ncbi:hypothetical protein ACQ5SP_01905 [Rhodovulum sp. YNF3179]|uniref:hypothetical protein n=1 Tax=Rhodovulum sp. YNF3179 TaxID=3425127 RepID=UPI003D33AF92